MYQEPARKQIVLINGVTVNACLEKSSKLFILWLEMLYGRAEYDEFGKGRDWDETMELCERTKTEPWKYKTLQEVNHKIRDINKYNDGTAFQ